MFMFQGEVFVEWQVGELLQVVQVIVVQFVEIVDQFGGLVCFVYVGCEMYWCLVYFGGDYYMVWLLGVFQVISEDCYFWCCYVVFLEVLVIQGYGGCIIEMGVVFFVQLGDVVVYFWFFGFSGWGWIWGVGGVVVFM